MSHYHIHKSKTEVTVWIQFCSSFIIKDQKLYVNLVVFFKIIRLKVVAVKFKENENDAEGWDLNVNRQYVGE